MEITKLFNYKEAEYETRDGFIKRLYDTAKRYCRSLGVTPENYWFYDTDLYVITKRLAKHYKEDWYDMYCTIIEANGGNKKYAVSVENELGRRVISIYKRNK